MPVSNHSRLLRQLQRWKGAPPAALVYVDLRHMRTINRLSSAGGGDGVIDAVTRALRVWAGAGGLAERVWSNEFVALKAIDHGQAAVEEAAALRDGLGAIRYASMLGDNHVAVSIGLIAVGAAPRWDDLLDRVAEACQAAKRRGLNQIVSYAPREEPAHQAQINAANVLDFRRLAGDGRLLLYPQPIMDIRGAAPRLRKAEFLLRMHAGEGPRPLPTGMIESLEYFGLTAELDRFTAHGVLQWITENGAALAQLQGVSMNLSAKSIVDGRFMDGLLRDVRALRIPRGKLCFEITETAAIEHLDVAAEVIEAFRSAGCRFSLDDFGSGLCSFGYLQTLPVDEVKIDGRFVRNVADDEVSREIVRAIHQVARATGKQTVAEFVDDSRKLAVLREMGVDYAQGWLFHPALPEEDFLQLVRRGAGAAAAA